MAPKFVKGVAAKTDRDVERSAHLAALHEEWALLDAKMDAVDSMIDSHAE